MARSTKQEASIAFELEAKWKAPGLTNHPVSTFDELDFDYKLFPVSLYWAADGKKVLIGWGGLLGVARDLYRWRRSKPRASVLELPDLYGGWRDVATRARSPVGIDRYLWQATDGD